MKKMCYLIMGLLFVFNISNAQSQTSKLNLKVSGKVQDSVTHEVVDYATVHLKEQKSGKSIKSTLTKADGTFEFDVADTGKYTIVVVGLGYAAKTIPFELKKSMDLGVIEVSKSSNKLGEVVVTADRPIVKQDIDRLTYDIQADPENKVLNVLDMMRKVPLLSVDGEENLQLKGSGNYKILLNGKPSAMLARNTKDALKAMNAADIEKIEVITTPPAKYDSEGLAGIINIITKKRVDNGYNASLTARESTPAGGPGGSASFTFKQGKFGISGFGGFFNQQSATTSNSNLRNTLDGNGNIQSVFQQLGQSSQDGLYHYISTELSFEIDTLDLITGSIDLNGSKYNSLNNQNAHNNAQDGTLLQQYILDNSSKNNGDGNNLSFNYQRNFKRNKEQLLTFSYQYDDYKNHSNNGVAISDQINYPLNNYQQNNSSLSNEQTFQLDYVHPVKKLNIEGGVKGILRKSDSDYQFYNQNPNSGDYELDPSKTNTFNYHQNVYGIYNSYQYKLKKWGFKGGLRLEATVINADFVSSASKVKQNYFNFIPTVAVNHSLKNNVSLSLGYTQRIERPGIWQLNPFVDRSNPNFISTGNPDLKPVISNSFNLNFSKFGKGSVNVSLSYDFANNTVQTVSVLKDNVTSSNYYNIGKNRRLGTNLSVNYPITKKLNFNLGGNINYIKLQGYLGTQLYKNDGLQGYVYGSASYRLEHEMRVNASFFYYSPGVRLQGSSNSSINSSLSISKDLVRDKLTFSAYVSNPFSKFRDFNSESNGANFYQISHYQNFYRRYSLSLNYKFGKLKGTIKKNKRGIQNNDVQGGGSGAGNTGN